MIEIGLGEFLDREAILEIKKVRVKDPKKLRVVLAALAEMKRAVNRTIVERAEVQETKAKLKNVNERLWIAENTIRAMEAKQKFGSEFIRTARSIYRLNDERSALKTHINIVVSSTNSEIKEYSA